MGEWTWLFAVYPLADIELISKDFEPAVVNVLVRTAKVFGDEEGVKVTVRVAPHNTAPFRGGPWHHTFSERDLLSPGQELVHFREALAREVMKCQQRDKV